MLGVAIVTYNAEQVILGCLDSLLKTTGAELRIAICDNASQDNTIDAVRNWAQQAGLSLEIVDEDDAVKDLGKLTLVQSSTNRGFAAGVNRCLSLLKQDEACDLFWVLNPDCEVAPDAASAFERCAEKAGEFALIGSRVTYLEPPGLIQSEGGFVGPWSGICRTVNRGANPAETARRTHADDLDFMPGASIVASRQFLDQAGPMPEDYFLYYEEVEWAARRGNLPMLLCPEATIYHHGGTAIGTGAVNRTASPFSLYFNYRNRMRYMRRIRPIALPTAYFASLARVAKFAFTGRMAEAYSAFLGLHQLPPPAEMRERLGPAASAVAFDRS